MALSIEQEEKMYECTVKACESITWIKTRLDKGDKRLDDCANRVTELEKEHSLLKGKLGAFVLGLTFIVSLLVNIGLWVWSHIGSK
jgi:hypothetical protein